MLEEIRKTLVCVGGNGLSLAWLDGARIVRQVECATINTQIGNLFGAQQAATAGGAWVMQDRVEPPVVRCPGCDQPMEAKERTPATERLVDIRYVCAGCGMETKRTVADEAL